MHPQYFADAQCERDCKPERHAEQLADTITFADAQRLEHGEPNDNAERFRHALCYCDGQSIWNSVCHSHAIAHLHGVTNDDAIVHRERDAISISVHDPHADAEREQHRDGLGYAVSECLADCFPIGDALCHADADAISDGQRDADAQWLCDA